MSAHTDTIVAVATAPGRGGIGVLRLSGPQAGIIAAKLAGALPAPRQATLRSFRDTRGEVIDQGLLLYFTAPNSFTGEDVVELQAHGSPMALQLLQQACCEWGARAARPGEFSERAFLNGRIDLAQAEAIADLIDAASSQALRAAQRSLDGELSRRVQQLAESLIQLRMYVEGALDFSDEDVDWLGDQRLSEQLAATGAQLAQLQHEAAHGRRLREGLNIALTGRPNVGKSTLLNRLAGADVAIVTEIAGTTRDVLREHLNLRGLPITLIDTAGLRDGEDPVEREGIRRAHLALQQAELALFIRDAREALQAEDRALMATLPAQLPRLIVHNKIDLAGLSPQRRESEAGVELFVCAASGQGLELLIEELHRFAGLQDGVESAFSARSRHLEALARCQQHLQQAALRLQNRQLPELAAEELRLGLEALGEITGRFGSEDLLGRIFASFCIGK